MHATARMQLKKPRAVSRSVLCARGLGRGGLRKTQRAHGFLEAVEDPHPVLTGIAEELFVRFLEVCRLPPYVEFDSPASTRPLEFAIPYISK